MHVSIIHESADQHDECEEYKRVEHLHSGAYIVTIHVLTGRARVPLPALALAVDTRATVFALSDAILCVGGL